MVFVGVPRYLSQDSKRFRRFAIVTLMVALLGPVRPLYVLVADPAPPSHAVVGDPDQPEIRVGSTSVEVDLPDSGRGFADASFASRTVRATDRRTALIIGINQAKGGSTLPGSIADATNLKDALVMYGFARKNITMLLDAQASRDAILHELDRLAERTPKNGLAVFAVATHTRIRNGQNELLTADGLRVSAGELGVRLARVRSKMWVALPTCYAAGYDRPGIVGRDRIATFASSATKPTYQLGSSGSYLFIKMVREAMLEGEAPGSVEEAFGYAKRTLEKESPDRVPSMSDGITGDLVLGNRGADSTATEDRPAPDGRRDDRFSDNGDTAAPTTGADPPPGPSQPPLINNGPGVCGRFSVRCER